MAATTELNFGRDVQGFNAYAPKPSTNMFSATITDATPETVTVPSNYAVWIVAFAYQPGTNVWVDTTGATAIIPVGATFAATTSALRPAAYTLLAGTSISFVTDNTSADVGVSMYAVTQP